MTAPRRRRRWRWALALVVLVGASAIFIASSPSATLRLFMTLERGRADLETKRIEVGDHEIVYLDSGAEKRGTPILMIHGFGADKDNWTRFARFFTDHRVVIPDLPGFGESTQQSGADYAIGAQVERLAAFTKAIDLPIHHVVGNSMGGNLAGAYAAEHTERVQSVAFFANSGITSPEPSEVAERRAQGEQPLLVSNREEYEALLDLVFYERPFLPDSIVAHFAAHAIASRAFNDGVGRDLAERPYPLEPVLPGIERPVFVLWGADDRVLDVSAIEVMQPLVPQAVVVVMPKCGHIPMVERPEETARHYRRFLNIAAADRASLETRHPDVSALAVGLTRP